MAALSVAEALARILDGVRPLEAEPVSLLDAHHRTLAADVTAQLTQPPFDASAMDGYAVRLADVARLPAALAVVGEAAAGSGFHGTLKPGEAVRILTGAPVPEGCDAIVIQENADPSVRHDMETWLERIAPEDPDAYRHDAEGPDDMPSHLRATITKTSEVVPISNGRLALGTWQAIYLWEHRRAPHTRTLIVHVQGVEGIP